MRSTPAAVAITVPAAVCGLLAGVAVAFAGAPWLVALVAAVVAAAALGAWIRTTATRRCLNALGARPTDEGANLRLDNLIDGVCTTHGFQKPSVHLVDSAAVNAASVGLGYSRGHLVVTRGALDSLDRLELEAVVARQLCELRRGTDDATAVAGVGRLPGGRIVAAPLRVRIAGKESAIEIDLEAVRLTSYPPALASALAKAASSPVASSPPATAHLWMVEPGDASSRRDGAPRDGSALVRERVDVLGEV